MGTGEPVRLPHFENPPVMQVVLGLAFEPLSRLRGSHLGLFWNALNGDDKFPKIDEFLYEPAMLERFEEDGSPDEIEVSIIDRAPVPRVVFSSADDSRQVAIQKDLLQVSWSRRGGRPYERYETTREMFSVVLEEFEKFLVSRHLGSLGPLQAEISYTNEISVDPSDAAGSLSRLVKFLSVGGDLLPNLDDLHLVQQHTLRADGQAWGRLYVSLDANPPARIEATEDESSYETVDLDISVQGVIEGGDVLAFLDRGHRVVVDTFLSITTESAQEAWGRLRGDA